MIYKHFYALINPIFTVVSLGQNLNIIKYKTITVT